MTPEKKDGLSYSHLTTFKNCRKKAYWTYQMSLEPVEQNPNFHQGSVFHDGLDDYYSGKLDDLDLKSHFDPFSNPDLVRLGGAKAIQTAAMLRSYIHFHPKEEEGWKILDVEGEFREYLRNPTTHRPSRSFLMHGRIDLLVQDGDDIYVVEHKTIGSITGDSIQRFWCNQQGLYYAQALAEQDIQINGVIYNLVAKSRIRQKQKETEQEFLTRMLKVYSTEHDQLFHREMVPILDHEQALHSQETWELAQEILRSRRDDLWYQNRSHCWLYNSKCPFWELCTSQGDQTVIDNLYQPRGEH